MDFHMDTIKVMVTSFCNLKCKHCYQHFEKNRFIIKKDKLIEIVDFAVKNNVRILDFGGGEFFTHPYAYEIMRYALENGLEVNVASNAYNINLDYIINLGYRDKLTFQFSVDGLKQTHDNRRGCGSFDNVIRNAKTLSSLGYFLTASMALDEKNYLEALDVMRLPYFEKVIFLPVGIVGAAKINSSKGILNDYEETLSYILKETQCDISSFSKQIFPNVMAIKYDGGVYLSPTAADFGLLSFGNINESNLSSIVESFLLSSDFKNISSVDSNNITECNSCLLAKSCDRGCRFRALKFFGDLMSPDPFYCKIYINKYRDIPIGKLFWGEK